VLLSPSSHSNQYINYIYIPRPFPLSAELGPNPLSQQPFGNQLNQFKFHYFGEQSGWLFCKSITTIQLRFSRRKRLLFLMLLYSLQVGLIQLFVIPQNLIHDLFYFSNGLVVSAQTNPNPIKPNVQQTEDRSAMIFESNRV
ncbi:hypothetical protein MJO28_011086, partial [Puccinia striiformis f. sp. tritici]